MSLASESASVSASASGVYPAVLPASYGADVLPFPSITEALAKVALRIAQESGIALAQWNLAGNIQVASPAFQALQSALQPHDWQAIEAKVHEVRAQGVAVVYQFVIMLKGIPQNFYCRFVPVLLENQSVIAPVINGIACAFVPLPSGRENLAGPLQHSFHDFARASSDWLWEVDAHDHIVAVSEQIAAIIEKPAFMLVGAPFDTLGSLEPNLSGESPYIQARPKRAPFRNQLKRLQTASGEVVYFHISGVPIFDAQGMFCGYRGAGMDVSRTYRLEIETHTARRNLEAALRALQAKNAELDVATLQAQSALTAKNEFLASMSHELRTPLNAIIGFAEAMELQLFGGLPNHYVGYARDIGAAGRHLLGLIEDILDVSVIESGEVALSYTAISLDALVARAKSLVLLRAQAKQLDLAHVEAPPNVLLHVDERRALQILVNLLTNAVKFTPAYGKIGVETCLEPTGFYKICVWDSGPGIEPQDYERVFERFEQCVGESYAGKPEGTGLGLHISRELARMMGGDLIVEQHTGAGARFALTLPAALAGAPSTY